MPKMKTHRGAAKRFFKTGSGGFKRSQALTNHLLEAKSSKRKRKLRKNSMVSPADAKRLKQMLTYTK